MAKIKVTRRTFSAKVAEAMDNAEGIEGVLSKALMGKEFKEYLSQQPDNMPLWVDTSKVVCVTDLITESMTKDVVFGIMFEYQQKLNEMMWIDGKDFEAFMKVWSDTDSQPEQQPDYASDDIARLWEEMDRLEKLARDERRKNRPDLSNIHTDGNATRFCSKCRSDRIETIGDLLKKGRTHILQLSGIGVNCAKFADTALKNLYGIENW